MGKQTRSVLTVSAAVAAMIFVILWMSGTFGSKIQPAAPETVGAPIGDEVALATVSTEVVPIREEAAGTVQAERKTTVSARILATIRAIEVNAGDEVERGQVLVRLASEDLGARVAEARRAVDAAAATRDNRAADFARARQLLKTGVVSQSEFDRAEEATRVAEAEFERAQQQLRTAEINLTYAEITSPVSGRVIDRLADPGDTATPGKPLLSLYDPTALRVEVPVRESLAVTLRPGDSLTVRLGADETTLAGTVDEIVPQAEAGSRTFLVKVGLPQRAGVYTGMFARVIIPAGERPRLLVPTDAVERVGQLTFVTVVDEEHRAHRQLVTLGPTTGDGRSEVLSGLRQGERVALP